MSKKAIETIVFTIVFPDVHLRVGEVFESQIHQDYQVLVVRDGTGFTSEMNAWVISYLHSIRAKVEPHYFQWCDGSIAISKKAKYLGSMVNETRLIHLFDVTKVKGMAEAARR